MKTINICCQKGGVGKTTTSEALILGLKEKGYRVLSLDLDRQGNLTSYLSPNHRYSVFDIVHGRIPIDDIIENDHIAGGSEIIYFEDYLKSNSINELKKQLKKVAINYDFFIIDTPPSISQLTYSALELADYNIIPCELTLDGITALKNTVATIRSQKKIANLLGVLITKYKKHYVLHTQLNEKLINSKFPMFNTTIRESQFINNAKVLNTNFMKNKSINAVNDYYSFIDEVIERIGGN